MRPLLSPVNLVHAANIWSVAVRMVPSSYGTYQKLAISHYFAGILLYFLYSIPHRNTG